MEALVISVQGRSFFFLLLPITSSIGGTKGGAERLQRQTEETGISGVDDSGDRAGAGKDKEE